MFTWNNPPPEYCDGDLPAQPAVCPVRYASWQREVGASGTEHLQGYAEFAAPVRLSAVRQWLSSSVHWEPRKGTREEARDYSRKDDSRAAGPWELGSFQLGGQVSALTLLLRLLLRGTF